MKVPRWEIHFFLKGKEVTGQDGYVSMPKKSEDGNWCHTDHVSKLERQFDKLKVCSNCHTVEASGSCSECFDCTRGPNFNAELSLRNRGVISDYWTSEEEADVRYKGLTILEFGEDIGNS